MKTVMHLFKFINATIKRIAFMKEIFFPVSDIRLDSTLSNLILGTRKSWKVLYIAFYGTIKQF